MQEIATAVYIYNALYVIHAYIFSTLQSGHQQLIILR